MTETTTKMDTFMHDHAGHDVRYLENVTSERRLVGVDGETGELQINSEYEVWDETGESPRLMCLDCLIECSLPDDAQIDWRL